MECGIVAPNKGKYANYLQSQNGQNLFCFVLILNFAQFVEIFCLKLRCNFIHPGFGSIVTAHTCEIIILHTHR